MSLYIGAMSGTSIDGLDLALVSIQQNEIDLQAGVTYPFPVDIQQKLIGLALAQTTDMRVLGETDAALGSFIGESIVRFLNEQRIEASAVLAIGSHGQTIRHEPTLENSFTLQIGNPSRIAEITGIDVIADFRSRDIAAGGQGAPLVPVYHNALFSSRTADLIVLNIGGISNVSVLPANEHDAIYGFDTGPGNALIDAWIRDSQRGSYDRDGRLSSTGKVIEPLLDRLMSDPWLQLPPPKSTGKEHFNLDYIRAALKDISRPAPEDVAATLCQFTAASIRAAILAWCTTSGDVVVCGGGRRNQDLMKRLTIALPDHDVQASENSGIDGDLIEAAAFAYLAHLFLERMPGNVPSVTGAKGPRILGSLCPANGIK